ncbi:MAG: DeoR/GlpR family DNA-binding transcription regulator [Herbiconiux sp.]|nr:DeoR/GlpR family DNA-binding transcription regulator [Herbiconiux sp.]
MITQRISELGEVSLAELASEFSVSEMTIRRDLDALEAGGDVRKVIGGAISLIGKSVEPPFSARAVQAAKEKLHLAKLAVSLLKPHETVLLDSGSTVLAVAREIRGKGLGLTIVTPSVLAAIELVDEPDTNVILTGGLLRAGELSLTGAEAQEALLRYNCDVYFMGIAGLDGGRGASDYNREEGEVKRAAVRASDRVIAVVDETKLGRIQLMTVALPTEINAIVTDAPVTHPVLMDLRSAGVEVYCAEAGEAI